MDEDMNTGELLKEVAEENQTRKILELVKECKSLDEAVEKIKALLEK
ncbi:MAG: protein phosphatase [Defluviitaleaceae bacterium]|nr:protein phosphatase [Defluviitaleaceae bacterium]